MHGGFFGHFLCSSNNHPSPALHCLARALPCLPVCVPADLPWAVPVPAHMTLP